MDHKEQQNLLSDDGLLDMDELDWGNQEESKVFESPFQDVHPIRVDDEIDMVQTLLVQQPQIIVQNHDKDEEASNEQADTLPGASPTPSSDGAENLFSSDKIYSQISPLRRSAIMDEDL